MRIGDLVNVSLTMEIYALEKCPITQNIYCTGVVKDEFGNRFVVRIPNIACEPIGHRTSRIEDVLRDEFLGEL